MSIFFFFNDTATTEIYTLSLHDALPIWGGAALGRARRVPPQGDSSESGTCIQVRLERRLAGSARARAPSADRKSTRLNSSHSQISYAVFCLKKKKKKYKKT